MRRSARAACVLLVATGAVGACVDPATTQPVASPVFYARNVKGYAETAAGLPPDTVLAWDLTVVGEVARWRECEAPDACTTVERSRPARELLGVERVGETTVDGRKGEVVRLSLAARPKYVVPAVKKGP